jgi:uncharacterized protein YdeI (YjbR/CyaY-like superfamily)
MPRKTPSLKPKRKSARAAAGPERIRTFRSQGDFAAWLEKNHRKSSGVWARIAKKGAKVRSMTYAEGLDVALCYGWIDALKRAHDESAWLQRFVPRRPRSLWSRINREKALALIESGEMKESGLAEVERARQDGRWDAAYDSPARAGVPQELEEALTKNERAREFFDRLDRTNRYAVIWRIQTAATAETRARRVATLVAMLEKGQKLH